MSIYAELAADLEHYRQLPYEELAGKIGGAVVERTIEGHEGPLTIEVHFGWARLEGGTIRITATAYGPSCWKLERHEEAVVVPRPDLPDAS